MDRSGSKSKGKRAGIPLNGGGKSGVGHIQRTGPQSPGVTSVAKGGNNAKFGAAPGGASGMGRQSVMPMKPGQTGKGSGAGGGGGGKRKKGYGGDANGNPY